MTSKDHAIADALLQWTRGIATLFDDSCLEGNDEAIASLTDVQNSGPLLCALLTVLQHEEGSFEEMFQQSLDAEASNAERLMQIVEALGSKYDRKFDFFQEVKKEQTFANVKIRGP